MRRAAALLLVAPLAAPAVEVAPVVVSTTRIPGADTIAPTTVITRPEIEARASASVADLLRDVAGVHVDQPGGRGGISSVYLRGADPNFTLVLLDGVRLNDPTNSRGGSFDLATIDPAVIERVEIARAPLSSVHGSDAMGGVVHIITRGGSPKPERSAALSAGTHDHARAALSLRAPFGDGGGYALSAAAADDGDPVPGSDFNGRNLHLKLEHAAPGDGLFAGTVFVSGSTSESFPDDSGGPQFAVRRAVEQRRAAERLYALEWTRPRAGGEYRVGASRYERDERIASPGVAPGARDPFGIPAHRIDNAYTRESLSAAAGTTLAADLRVVAGFETQHEQGTSTSLLFVGPATVPGAFARTRRIHSPFVELRGQYARWTVEGGVRVDDASGFKAETSPRAGLGYALGGGTRVYATWAESFKLPSLFALGNPVVGNPALLPETGAGVEVGISRSAGDGQVRLSWFRNRYVNLIDLTEGPPPRLVNRDVVILHGVEIEARHRFANRAVVEAQLTYVDSDPQGSAEPLRNRPRWRASVALDWPWRTTVQARLAARYVGESPDSSIPTGARTLDDYVRVDATVRWQRTPDFSVTAAVDNLLDASYEEAVGFPAPGVRPRIELKLRF